MVKFDLEYFQAIQKAINTTIPAGVPHWIANYTKDYEKFIFHLCYYIDATCNPPHEGWKHIELIEGDLVMDNRRYGPYSHFTVLPLAADVNGLGAAKMQVKCSQLPPFEHPYRNYIVESCK